MIGLLLSIVCCFTLAACGPGHEAQRMQERVDGALNDMDRDRDAVRLELMDLRKDIDQRILDTEEELLREDMPEQEKEEKRDLLRELQKQRNRVQQALLEVENADESTWIEIKQRSKKTTRSVDGWFDSQAELEDLKANDMNYRTRPV